MPQRGRSGGRRPPHRGGRGVLVDDRGSPSTNSPSSIRPRSMESTNPMFVKRTPPSTQQESPVAIVGETIPTTFSTEAAFGQPTQVPGSVATKVESGNMVDQRPWLQADKGEFIPANGPPAIISRIIKQKFDEPSPTWRKVSLELRDRWFGEFKKEYIWDVEQEQAIRSVFDKKGSRILKNSMNKVRNGKDKGIWIPPAVRASLDLHWSFPDFQNKSVIAKANRAVDKDASAYCGGSISTAAHFEKMEQYMQRREEVHQHNLREGSSSQESPIVSIDDNEIYFSVVGGENKKGNVYGLGIFSKKFTTISGSQSSISQTPVLHQIEQMRETIEKLNAELVAKHNKEKTLQEELQELRNNQRQQDEQMKQMQLILQHIQMNSHPMPDPSHPTTSQHDTDNIPKD